MIVNPLERIRSIKVKLKPVRRTLAKPRRVTIRITLPERARLALAGGRPVTVRLSMKAKIGKLKINSL